jgi:hypothetical protein
MGRSGTRTIWHALQRAGYSADFTHKSGSLPKRSANARFVISPIREPISRNMSAYLFNFCKSRTPSLSDFMMRYSHEVPLTFFDKEIEPYWGIDVYETPFDKQKGWQVYEGENVRLLVIRLEDLTRWGDAFKALTGKDAPTLKHENKTKSVEGLRFMKTAPIPEDYRQWMYGSRYYQHFYVEDSYE